MRKYKCETRRRSVAAGTVRPSFWRSFSPAALRFREGAAVHWLACGIHCAGLQIGVSVWGVCAEVNVNEQSVCPATDWWPHQSRASTPASWLMGLAPATLATLRWWLRENEMNWKMKALKYKRLLNPGIGLRWHLLNVEGLLENRRTWQNPQTVCS